MIGDDLKSRVEQLRLNSEPTELSEAQHEYIVFLQDLVEILRQDNGQLIKQISNRGEH